MKEYCHKNFPPIHRLKEREPFTQTLPDMAVYIYKYHVLHMFICISLNCLCDYTVFLKTSFDFL